jgi:hypothetical protein
MIVNTKQGFLVMDSKGNVVGKFATKEEAVKSYAKSIGAGPINPEKVKPETEVVKAPEVPKEEPKKVEKKKK